MCRLFSKIRLMTFLGFDLVLGALRRLRLRPSSTTVLAAMIYLLKACELLDEFVSSLVSPRLPIVSTRCHRFNWRVVAHLRDADMSCCSFSTLV